MAVQNSGSRDEDTVSAGTGQTVFSMKTVIVVLLNRSGKLFLPLSPLPDTKPLSMLQAFPLSWCLSGGGRVADPDDGRPQPEQVADHIVQAG